MQRRSATILWLWIERRINLLDFLELKIFVLSLAYLGNAHVQIILSLA